MSKKLLEKGIHSNEKSSILIFPILAMFLLGSEQSQGESFFNSMFQKEEKIPEASQIAGKVIDRAAAKIQKKFQAFPVGLGLGGDIHTMSLALEINKVLSIEEARSILIGSRKILLDEINTSEKLKNYLAVFPFENTDLSIIVKNEDGSSTADPQICALYSSKGSITYLTNDPENEFKYKNTFTETLEEAEFKNQEYLQQLQEKRRSES